MKTLFFLPLAYLAGVDGFAIFAPYLAVMLILMSLFSRPRERTSPRSSSK